ncbi:MAG: outer membrane protein assembly factor BamA [Proteobacteria bacterium]|nr:outer membrane protein assembly factor BamA [Pseudomonadota bacterium]
MNFSRTLALFIASILIPLVLGAQSNPIFTRGEIAEINLEGIQLIEKGLIYSKIDSAIGLQLSPAMVSNDIKNLFKLGYFKEIKVEYQPLENKKIALSFIFVEKPRIESIEFEGNVYFDVPTLKEKLQVHPNNMLNLKRIQKDVEIILDEYRKNGYLRTRVSSKIEDLTDSTVLLTYIVRENPKVFLTKINVTGTENFFPLDIERLMQSSEIDCFAWANDSGVFQEAKVNQDLQIITQTYLQKGFIKVKIDKPKVVLLENPDYSEVIVDLNITEGEQYYAGKIDILSADGEEFVFDKEEVLAGLALQEGQLFNPFKQNRDQFKIRDIYLEQGYAKSRVRSGTVIHDDTKTVDIIYRIFRGEKAYIDRIEIQGNYETLDSVIRRELDIHDNELYNGLKIRESQRKITRLGFFAPGTGIQFRQSNAEEENMLDYHILLEEAQTGSLNAALSYSGNVGFALTLKVSKKNILGTGKTVSISAERQGEGDTRYDFSLITPYWFDTNFTNSFGIFSTETSETNYNVSTNGFNFGLSYPVWKNLTSSSRFSYKVEDYRDINETGEETLEGATSNSFRSLLLGTSYNTVNHPMFPSDGYEASVSVEQFGGFLGGSTEYRSYAFNTRWFSSLNDDKTVVFMARFRHNRLEQTNSSIEIPSHKRFSIGGITTVRGFEWYDIKGPTSESENPDNYLQENWPHYSDGCDSTSDTTITGVSCNSLNSDDDKHADRLYLEQHTGGILQSILNVELLFPLTREGQNIRGVIFYDAGNVWAENKVYSLTGNKNDPAYFRRSAGAGVRVITPMGVLRFEYGLKLDPKKGESSSKFDFHISGLF